MATKTIDGSYSNGYTLAPTYNGVNVTKSGTLFGTTGGDGVSDYNSRGGVGSDGDPGGIGLALLNGGSVTNNGTIAGGQGGIGGNGYVYYYMFSMLDSGFIGHGGDGGQGGDGIQSASFATITNFGSIKGGPGGDAGANVGYRAYEQYWGTPGAGGVGINLTAGGNVTNYGDVRGGLGIYLGAAGTVINHGTVEGGVKFGAPGGTLIAYGGSSLRGGAWGDGGTLQLMGGASTGIIEGISGFGSVTFANGANWDFLGDNVIPTGLAIVPGGTLTVDGSLTTDGSVAGLTDINGTLDAQSDKTLTLQGGTLSNFSGWTLTRGTFAVDAGGLLQLPNNDIVKTLQAALNLTGAGSDMQALKTSTSKQFSIEQSLTTIGAGGKLALTRDWSSSLAMSNAGNIVLNGVTFGARSLKNTGTITGAGTINAPTTSTGFIDVFFGDTLTFDGAANTLAGVVLGTYSENYTEDATVRLEAGTTTLSTLTINVTLDLDNAARVLQTGVITLAYGTITNEAGATWGMANGIFAPYLWEVFTNDGLLRKIGEPDLVQMGANFVNTGTISIGTGAIDFTGQTIQSSHPQNTFGGTINGQGTLMLGGGTNIFAPGLALSVAHVMVQGTATNVDVNTNLTYLGQWVQTAGTVSVAAGDTLAVRGASDTLAGEITGAGHLTTTNTVTVKQLTLGGMVRWNNSGAVTQTGGTFSIGDGGVAIFNNQAAGAVDVAGKVTVAAGAQLVNAGKVDNKGTLTLSGQVINSGTITNEAGAKLIFAANVAITTDPSVKAGAFTNAGLVEKLSGTGTSIIRTGNASLTDTGTIDVETGTLELTGQQVTVAGLVKGAGTIEFGVGTMTLAAGSKITTAGLTIAGTGAHVVVARTLGYANDVSVGANTELTIESGDLLQFTDGTTITGAVIDGAGRLTTAAATTLSLGTLGGTVQWRNSGTLTETGQFTIGDALANKAEFSNLAAGTFALAGNVGIGIGTSASSDFVNAGLLKKTGGTGTSAVDVALVNNGMVEVAAGTLDLEKSVTGSGGTLQIDSRKVLQTDASVSAGQKVLFQGTNDKLTLTDAADFHAKLSGFAATDKVDLTEFGAGTTLAYSGNATTGTLTVTDGALQAKLTLLGQYAAAGFHIGTDSHGGSLVTYNPPPSPNLVADHLAPSTV